MKATFILGLSLLLINIPTNAQENWEIINSGTTNNLTDVFFIDNNLGWIIGYSGTLLRTTDAGESWNLIIIPYQNLIAIQFVNQNIGWIVGGNGLIIKTTDAGNNWFEQAGGQGYLLSDLHFFDDQTGIICGGTILRTTNGGSQWDEIGLPNYSPTLLSIYFLNSNLGWTAGANEIIFRTIDGGVSWDSIGYASSGGFDNYNYGIYFLDSLNGNVCGRSNSGTGNTSGPIYKTSDGGYSWIHVAAVGYGSFRSLAYHTGSNSLYSVGLGGWLYVVGKIYKSTNGGNDWTEISCPTSEYLNEITFTKHTGWIVGQNGIILNRDMVSSIDEIFEVLNYSLSQNYPNPFNPATKIKYQIPELSIVTIKIYDVLGNEITTLVNEEKSVGSYEVEFGGTELPSGIYFYQLKAGNFIETKKMVLLK